MELGFFVALTLGQQRWIKTLGIGHHEFLAGTDGGLMAARGREERGRSMAATDKAPPR